MKTLTFDELKDKSLELFYARPPRERVIIVVMLVMAVFVSVDSIWEPISETFKSQSEKLETVRRQLIEAPIVIEKHAKLLNRITQIDQEFNNIEFKEGPLSHIESLIKEKMNLPSSSFRIAEQTPSDVGTKYQQSPFRINFKIDDMTKLVDFLDALANGTPPLVINEIYLNKQSTSGLDVNLEVYGITRK